ncbi:MAG: zf-HC2 domain-containing protein [Acidobacteriota bacterium]
MNCNDCRDRLSARIEGLLSSELEARVGEHLLSCLDCRAIHDELVQLLDDLPLLSDEIPTPEGLEDRLLEAAPAPRSPGRRRMQALAWQRAAAWAVVFLGAWVQLIGPRVGHAADRLAPVAEDLVVAFERTALEGAPLLEPVDRASGHIVAWSQQLSGAFLAPASAPSSDDASSGEVVPLPED